MGTRNLIAVLYKNKWKVAQYGQWDGYPAGEGNNVLNFLTKTFNKDTFIEKLKNVKLATDRELLNMSIDYPEFKRDAGSDILDIIHNSNKQLLLENDIDFACDSLFCEYAYIINLDNDTLEFYKGCRTTKPKGRFKNLKPVRKDYYPISLKQVIPFKELDFYIGEGEEFKLKIPEYIPRKQYKKYINIKMKRKEDVK